MAPKLLYSELDKAITKSRQNRPRIRKLNGTTIHAGVPISILWTTVVDKGWIFWDLLGVFKFSQFHRLVHNSVAILFRVLVLL